MCDKPLNALRDDMSIPTVVLHIDADGNVKNYADGDMRVIWVSDVTPEKRIYRTDPDPIPEAMIDGDPWRKTEPCCTGRSTVFSGSRMTAGSATDAAE